MSNGVADFLDTSVLIAAHHASRPRHAESRLLVEQATRHKSACAAHSLAEVYSVLSRLPGGWRQRPDFAGELVQDIVLRMGIVALNEEEYIHAIQSAANLKIAGGTIFDALLVACARKIDAERIYTWNVRHFKMVAPDLAERIVTP